MTVYQQRLNCKDCHQPMALYKKTTTNIRLREFFHCDGCEARAERVRFLKGNIRNVQLHWIAPNLPYEETEETVVVSYPETNFYPVIELTANGFN